MQTYEERKQARINSLKKRAEKKRAFAKQNDLSLYGEEKSGIPMGQPILVGHHSEARHRKHLARIESKVRKGYEASKEADVLEDRAEAAEKRRAIDSDNPEAIDLLRLKIAKLEQQRDQNKRLNQLVRAASTPEDLAKLILGQWPDFKEADLIASKLLEKDFMGRIGIPPWWFTNTGAEIRRLKKRLVELDSVKPENFEAIEANGIKAYVEEGRVVLQFDFIPSKEVREKLKSNPLSFKWSPKNQVWCRKHTPTTNSEYFKHCLRQFIEGVKNEQSI